MMRIIYTFGELDGTFPLDPAQVTGDLAVDSTNTYLLSLMEGKIVALDNNGNVKLAEDGDLDIGMLVQNALGNPYENTPAIASGFVAVAAGGGVFETDQVVESDIKPADLLYIGVDDNKGLLTKTKPNDDSAPVAVARTANSAEDKTVRVKM